ncbi:MAG: tripartite tricarboxylate transporter TctB family protein [Fretibacterium sp.]|nr:tripartite tricarboxylate transporter TctB family protein [Fretibacterium sp.]
MKKTDIGVCAVMYAVCLFFLSMTLQLPKAARIYPLCIITLLAALTTLHVVNMLIAAKREGVSSGLEDFKDFLPGQFFPLFIMVVGYLALMPYLGFYLSSALFMAGSLLFLRVKWWQILLAAAVLLTLVYGAFTVFLGVRLPAGQLFL